MRLGIIIPDRGDRPRFTENCIRQIKRMDVPNHVTLGVDLINHPPASAGFDLRDRIKLGVERAAKVEKEWVIIIENDDYYPADYIQLVIRMMESGYDFIGDDQTIYYHLKNKVYKTQHHKGRASLFTTAFRVSAMANFPWQKANKLFVDIDIWEYAKKYSRGFFDSGAVGIKHGIGLCGSVGHRMTNGTNDHESTFLRSRVDQESFDFYQNLFKN